MIIPELIKVDELKDIDAESVVLLSPEDCYDELKSNFDIRSRNVFGAVFPGVIFKGKVYKDKLIVLRFDFEVKGFRGYVPEDTDAKTILVFADGLYEECESALENVYFSLGNKVKYIGGGAGSLNKKINCLFDRNGFFSDNVLLIALPYDCKVEVKHGWQETGISFISTKTSGRKIIELNWTPAFEAYKKALNTLGVEIYAENFFNVAMAYPFGISKIKGEDVIRDPLYLEGTSIICAGKVPENHILKLMVGDKDKLIEAAKDCTSSINANISFDCISRVLYLGERFNEEVKYLKDTFGALTIGEVACSKGIIEFFNKTIVAGELYGSG